MAHQHERYTMHMSIHVFPNNFYRTLKEHINK